MSLNFYGDEVFLSCDFCNPEMDPDADTGVSHDVIQESNISQALSAGWEETEFGHLCPACVQKEKELEEMGDSTLLADPEAALQMISDGVIDPKEKL